MKQALKLTFAAILILTSLPAVSAASNGTLFVDTPVELNATDLTAICKDISRDGNAAWIELEEDNVVRYSHILKEGDPIVYRNDSTEWVAYRIDAIFRGIEHDLIELSPVDPPVDPPIDPSAIDFDYVQGLTDNFILDLDEQKEIGGGTTLRCTGIDLPDGAAWIELSKNGTVQYSHILQEGEYFTYEDAEIGIPRCCGVHRVFAGVTGNLVEFSPISPVRSDFDVSSVPDRSDYIMVGLGELVELSGGAKLLCKQIDQDGENVWIEIERNEYEVCGKVINMTSPFTYGAGDKNYVYDLEAVFLGTEKSAIEISFVGSSPVAETPASDSEFTYAIPAFTAFAAIVVLGLLAVVRRRRR